MTDHQFECLHALLVCIANDLSAIRGLLEKQQAPAFEFVGEDGPLLVKFSDQSQDES